MGAPEALVENYLCRRVEALGGFTRKVTYQGRRGSPDRWCFLPGGVLLIVECKAPGGRLSALQTVELATLTKQGFTAVSVFSRDEVDSLLERFDGL